MNNFGFCFHTIIPREDEAGLVESKVRTSRVWEWPEGEAAPDGLRLIIRQDSRVRLGHSISNAPADTPAARLAHWKAGRFLCGAGFSECQKLLWNFAISGAALPDEYLLLSADLAVELADWALAVRSAEEGETPKIQRRHVLKVPQCRKRIRPQAKSTRGRVVSGILQAFNATKTKIKQL